MGFITQGFVGIGQTVINESMDLELVTELMRDSSRKAGFTPCSGIDHLITLDSRQEAKPLVSIDVKPENRSSLGINRMSEHFNTVLKVLSPIELLTTDIELLNQNHPVIIADCYHAEVKKIQHVNHRTGAQAIQFTTPLVFVYQPPIYMGEWLEETYFTASKKHVAKSLFYSLQHAEELTTAVQAMSVNLTTHQGRTLAEIILKLASGREVELATMVRAY